MTIGEIVKGLLSGQLLTREYFTRNLMYIVFVFFLLIVSIWNRNNANYLFRQKRKLNIELKDLRAEYVEVSSDLMLEGTHTEIVKKVKEKRLGLVESKIPPFKIVVKKIEK